MSSQEGYTKIRSIKSPACQLGNRRSPHFRTYVRKEHCSLSTLCYHMLVLLIKSFRRLMQVPTY